MLLYRVNDNLEWKGFEDNNTFLVLTDDERDKLPALIEQLIIDTTELRNDKQLRAQRKAQGHPFRWHPKDEETIQFLKKMTHYGEYPESAMLDITVKQAMQIVAKLLTKTYGKKTNIFKWMNIDHRTLKQIHDGKSVMDHKRSCKAKYESDQLLKKLEYTTPNLTNLLEF